MKIGVVNYSSRVSNQDVQIMTLACAQQASQSFCPAWEILVPDIRVYTDVKLAPPDANVIGIFDNADQAGALGYHTENNDIISGRVFAGPVLDNLGVSLFDAGNPQNTSVASVLSHEMCELIADPTCNAWCDGPMITQGSEYAKEVADPVEGNSYPVAVTDQNGNSVAVSLSNFVFPSWFDPQAQAGQQFDQMCLVTAPFTMTQGGYMIVRAGPGLEQQVMGASYPSWKIATKKSPLSRTEKRIH